jgi:hypothetical protein
MAHRMKAAWACSWLAAGLAVAWALWRPGDAAFWISPLLLAPLFILIGDRYEQRINTLPSWKLRGLSVALLALALAGGLIAAIGATDTAYLLGSMLGTPVVMLLVLHNEKQDIDPAQASSESFSGPLGLP